MNSIAQAVYNISNSIVLSTFTFFFLSLGFNYGLFLLSMKRKISLSAIENAGWKLIISFLFLFVCLAMCYWFATDYDLISSTQIKAKSLGYRSWTPLIALFIATLIPYFISFYIISVPVTSQTAVYLSTITARTASWKNILPVVFVIFLLIIVLLMFVQCPDFGETISVTCLQKMFFYH